MAIEVKEEKFGSRPSMLEPLLKQNEIFYEKNIFVITCRGEFNRNTPSRYLILKEFLSSEEMQDISLETISNFLKDFMRGRVWGCHLDEGKEAVKLLYKGKTFTFSYRDFKELLLELMDCKFERSSARGSDEATPLSRFFREYLGKSVSVTDLDFFIPSSGYFLEEKTFVSEEDGELEVYIGLGQFISFRELRTDILNPRAKIFLIYTEDARIFYLKELSDKTEFRKKTVPGWGLGVSVRLDKTLEYKEFIKMLRG